MERDELLALCDRFVRRRDSGSEPPVRIIVTSYRLGDISESEKNSLLAYVSDPEDEHVADWMDVRLECDVQADACSTSW